MVSFGIGRLPHRLLDGREGTPLACDIGLGDVRVELHLPLAERNRVAVRERQTSDIVAGENLRRLADAGRRNGRAGLRAQIEGRRNGTRKATGEAVLFTVLKSITT